MREGVVSLGLLLVALLACGNGGAEREKLAEIDRQDRGREAAELAKVKASASASPATPRPTGPLEIRQEEFGERWPFTVAHAELGCGEVGGHQAAVVGSNGKIYALNGTAKGIAQRLGWESDITPIWRDNPAIPGTKVSIGPMIDLARTRCTTTPVPKATSPTPPPTARPNPLGGIYAQVATDAVEQYEMVKRNKGSAMELCVQAGMVTAAFLQAKDEESYKTWKATEKKDCARAGVPQ